MRPNVSPLEKVVVRLFNNAFFKIALDVLLSRFRSSQDTPDGHKNRAQSGMAVFCK